MKIDRFTLVCAATLMFVIVALAVVMGNMAYDLWLSGLSSLALIPVMLALVCIALLLTLLRDLTRVKRED